MGVAGARGSNWKAVCQYPPPVITFNSPTPVSINFYQWVQEQVFVETHSTVLGCMTMSIINTPTYPGDPDGLANNVCWPQALQPGSEEGFALLAWDEYYNLPGNSFRDWYSDNPYPASVTNGKTRPLKKRSVRFDEKAKRFFVDTSDMNKMIFQEDLKDDVELQMAVLDAAPKPAVPNEALDTEPTSSSSFESISATLIRKSSSTPTARTPSVTNASSASQITPRIGAGQVNPKYSAHRTW